jgi:hypothetical protein
MEMVRKETTMICFKALTKYLSGDEAHDNVWQTAFRKELNPNLNFETVVLTTFSPNYWSANFGSKMIL